MELRYFGGLTVEETAEALGVSVRTVIIDWNTLVCGCITICRSVRQAGDG